MTRPKAFSPRLRAHDTIFPSDIIFRNILNEKHAIKVERFDSHLIKKLKNPNFCLVNCNSRVLEINSFEPLNTNKNN